MSIYTSLLARLLADEGILRSRSPGPMGISITRGARGQTSTKLHGARLLSSSGRDKEHPTGAPRPETLSPSDQQDKPVTPPTPATTSDKATNTCPSPPSKPQAMT